MGDCGIWFVFAVFAICLSAQNSAKIRKIEKIIRDNNSGHCLRQNIKEVLMDYIGKNVDLEFYEDETDLQSLGEQISGNCTLTDIDERWVLLHIKKKKKEYDRLVRIESIKAVCEKNDKIKKDVRG